MRYLRNIVAMVVAVMIAVGAGLPSKAAAKEEIVVWMWTAHAREQFLEWFDKITVLFEEAYPGKTLTFEFVSGTRGESLITAVAGGAPPDAYLLHATSAQALYDLGVMTPLNKYIDETPHMALENFIPSSIAFGQKNGQVFGLPWSLEARTLIYNRDHFLESGLDGRRESLRSWDDVITASQRLVRREATSNDIVRSGFILGKSVSHFAAYLYANGGSFYNETLDGVAFNDPRGVEVLETMARFTNELDVERRGSRWADIRAKTASLVVADTSSISGIERGAPDFADWLDMALIPVGSYGDQSSTVTWSNLFVIPHGAKNPDGGWNFIEFWLRPDIQEEYFVHFDGHSIRSPRRDFFQSDTFIDAMRRYPYMEVQPDIFNYSQPIPYIQQDEVGRIMTPLIRDVLDGTMAPSVALEEAERLANVTLQQN